MRYTKTLIGALLPMLMAPSLLAAEPFALVELFTSEGCSSCPPADKLASELVKEAEKDDRNLYVLSFHVDYWDRLGWKDPYSSEGATERQSAYAIAWRARSAYTPQMVVNGAVGFNGSNRAKAEQEIDKALERPAPVEVVAQVSSEGADDLEVRATLKMEVELLHRDWDVIAAVVERGLSQKPDRGENKGRKLAHDNVVRVFDTKALEGDSADFELTIPGDVDREKSSVIVFLQDQRTRKILGVTRVELPKNE
jgi:hypothetical protein